MVPFRLRVPARRRRPTTVFSCVCSCLSLVLWFAFLNIFTIRSFSFVYDPSWFAFQPNYIPGPAQGGPGRPGRRALSGRRRGRSRVVRRKGPWPTRATSDGCGRPQRLDANLRFWPQRGRPRTPLGSVRPGGDWSVGRPMAAACSPVVRHVPRLTPSRGDDRGSRGGDVDNMRWVLLSGG